LKIKHFLVFWPLPQGRNRAPSFSAGAVQGVGLTQSLFASVPIGGGQASSKDVAAGKFQTA